LAGPTTRIPARKRRGRRTRTRIDRQDALSVKAGKTEKAELLRKTEK
jgi:hypothetical protein